MLLRLHVTRTLASKSLRVAMAADGEREVFVRPYELGYHTVGEVISIDTTERGAQESIEHFASHGVVIPAIGVET